MIEDGVRVERVRQLPEALLRFRGFASPLSHLPFAVAALHKGDYDVAHAFSAVDAMAALRWRQWDGGPVVFTCVEPPARETLADGRQRLRMTSAAFSRSDVVTAATAETRDAIRRWLALEVEVIDPADAAGFVALYPVTRRRPDSATIRSLSDRRPAR